MELTYDEVGATRPDREMPDGYRQVRRETLLGQGQAVFTAAVTGLRTFRMQRAAGLGVRTDAPQVEPGVTMATGLGVGPVRIWAPTQVVWMIDSATRFGYGMGTVTGHPEHGEEGFTVTLGTGGDVRFSVRSFARPAAWYMRLGGPVSHLMTDMIVGRYLRAMRKLTAAAHAAPAAPGADHGQPAGTGGDRPERR